MNCSLWVEGIRPMAAKLRNRTISCLDVAKLCLDRIAETDQHLKAWTFIDVPRVLAHAAELDRLADTGVWLGDLHGIPIGIKDIIDVQGLPTSAGYSAWSGAIAREDAEVVARLRSHGAIILGKTATCTFASFDPASTVHPVFDDKTPGGSSAGSAVAVAAGHCPVALGTQTGGSILRPAAYCGVVGFKPSHGLVSVKGAVPLAPTLDHIGFLANSPSDTQVVLRAIAAPVWPECPTLKEVNSAKLVFWADVENYLGKAGIDYQLIMNDLIKKCEAWRTTSTPPNLPLWLSAHHKIMAFEAFNWHDQMEPCWREKYPPKVASLLQFGASLSGQEIADTVALRHQAKKEMTELLADGEVLCLPSTQGEIPMRNNTGDYRYQGLASLIGWPAIGLPCGDCQEAACGKGVQMVGKYLSDIKLLQFARELFCR